MNNSPQSDCPFCSLPPERIREKGVHGFVIDDVFPVSPGHSLIIAK